MLHHIRKTILDNLATAKSRRYSELKPDDLDGNVFSYHLKGLLSDDYAVKQTDGSYSLTSKGRDYVVHRYEDPTRSAHSIFLLVIKNGDSYLLRRRKVQPMLGYTGFIHGEPDPSISVVEAAQQRLLDKTGLTMSLEVKGSALIAQYVAGELQSYSHAIILYGEADQTSIKASDTTGENSWGTLNEVSDILASCSDILLMIEAGSTWLEKSYEIE